MALASPFFQSLQLENYGLRWVHPRYPVAHPLDGGRLALMHRSVAATADSLGRDASAYFRLMQRLSEKWPYIDREVLGPLSFPRRPFSLAWFGLQALCPARPYLNLRFRGAEARALLGGIAAHATLPLDWMPSLSVALVMGVVGHLYGWPLAQGGSAEITRALVKALEALGGQVVCSHWVKSWNDLPSARLKMFDLTPAQFLALAGSRLPGWYRALMQRFQGAPGVFKIDYALSEPVPWTHPEASGAGTLHLAGDLNELARGEAQVWRNEIPESPYVLVSQPSLFDSTRAPQGKHVLWAYCHVPRGCSVDMTEAVERQLERFAPGFREVVLARKSMGPADFQAYNPNYVGGDITGGAMLLQQIFTRPMARLNPYSTPLPGVYLCSSSTPPGGGVHGQCGHHAALSAYRECYT